MNDQKRAAIAIAVCLLSATAGAYFVMHGKSSAWTAFDIGVVWTFAADWLGKRLWLLGLTFGGIRDEAKRGGMTMRDGVARVMSVCGNILLGAALLIGAFG